VKPLGSNPVSPKAWIILPVMVEAKRCPIQLRQGHGITITIIDTTMKIEITGIAITRRTKMGITIGSYCCETMIHVHECYLIPRKNAKTDRQTSPDP
jgi:hypothetical protein